MAEVQTQKEKEHEAAVAGKDKDVGGKDIAKHDPKDVTVQPQSVVQATFPSTIREGVPGMVNRMVDYNAVSRSCDTPPGIPACRAVSQSTAWDGGCIIGGSASAFLGLSILDPTIVVPAGSGLSPDTTPRYGELGILTKGEMFATAPVAVLGGDPVSFIATDGTLTNTGGVVIPGARWKYTRPNPGDLNVVQLGIQR